MPGIDRDASKKQLITCANCRSQFTWDRAYWQRRTPGSRDSVGYGLVVRAFCPLCGAIVCEGTVSAWKWVGDNQSINADKDLPRFSPVRHSGEASSKQNHLGGNQNKCTNNSVLCQPFPKGGRGFPCRLIATVPAAIFYGRIAPIGRVPTKKN
jgi:hypothetical protein